MDTAKGIGPGDLNSNLVIHGDNLHALKALLPTVALPQNSGAVRRSALAAGLPSKVENIE